MVQEHARLEAAGARKAAAQAGGACTAASGWAQSAQEEQRTNPDLIALKQAQLLREKIAKMPLWQQELMKKKHGIDDLSALPPDAEP